MARNPVVIGEDIIDIFGKHTSSRHPPENFLPGPWRSPACTREPSPTYTLYEKSDVSRPRAEARGLEKSDLSSSVCVGESFGVHAGPLWGPGRKLSGDAESKSSMAKSLNKKVVIPRCAVAIGIDIINSLHGCSSTESCR